MLTVREHIDIAAPVDRVFAFMDRPTHQADITPSLSDSTLLERLDYAPDERIVWSMEGDLQGTIRWYFEPSDAGCRITYAATYQSPGPRLLRPLIRPLIRRYNEQEVSTLLHNLKKRLESPGAPER
ncbi:MAG: SRPBCC family protein [Bacteroidetes bacterium QH_7_64_110]|nr:MAG: SRPBCC family protein [Bacteroidetes bacterium QH_7_64_110]